MMEFGNKYALVLFLPSTLSLRAVPEVLCAVLLSSVLAGFVSCAANAGRDALETPCAAQETAALTVRIDQRAVAEFLTYDNT